MILEANTTSDGLRPTSHAARMEHGAPSVTNRDVSSKLVEEGGCLVQSFLSQPRSCLLRILPPLPWMHLDAPPVTIWLLCCLLLPLLLVRKRLRRCIVAAHLRTLPIFASLAALLCYKSEVQKTAPQFPTLLAGLHSHTIFGMHPHRLRKNAAIGHTLRNIF